MSTIIHPTAIVDKNAQIGVDVEIGAYAIVEANTQIGDKTKIGASAQIREYTKIGTGNEIFGMACVGGEPQDLKFHGEESWLEIGNNNKIREFSTIHRGTADGCGVTRVGSGCLIMAYVHIAHDCQIHDNVVFSNAAMLAGHVEIASNVIIGGMTAVHQFVRVGENAFIGGMTGVSQDIPPYMLVAGTRAKLRGLNSIGLRRHNMASEDICALKKAFKIMWQSNLLWDEALIAIEPLIKTSFTVENLYKFLKSSERGIVSLED